MRPFGEVLVQISQQGAEILSGLHFVMLCPYLRGQSTFGGYFVTRRVLLHRSTNICCHFCQKCSFRVLASMEVKQPSSSESCKVCPKSAHLERFQYGLVNRGLRYWSASIMAHFHVWSPLRPRWFNHGKPVKYM